MAVVTLGDLEAQSSQSSSGNWTLLSRAPGSSVTWSTNVGFWLVLMLLANLFHPPALLMFALNGVLLGLNVDAVAKVGRSNTPSWLLVVIALQAIITLQYAAATLRL